MAIAVEGRRLSGQGKGNGGILAVVLLAGLSLALPGCTHHVKLEPATRNAVVEGVAMTAEPGVWSGKPVHLARLLTPIELTMQNGSGRSLRVCFTDLALVTNTGVRYPAIPPLRIKAVVPPSPIRQPRFASNAFFVAPYYTPYYGDYLHVWLGSFHNGSASNEANYRRWAASLPTRDMIDMAIPEGVLKQNGRLSGFLYFEKIARGAREVSLVATLIDAATGQRFGEIRLRFAVK